MKFLLFLLILFNVFEGVLGAVMAEPHAHADDIERNGVSDFPQEAVRVSPISSFTSACQRFIGRRYTTSTSNSYELLGSSSSSRVEAAEQNDNLSSGFIRKKRIVGFIDSIFYFYRCLLPVSIWIRYFSYGFGGLVFISAYIFFKFSVLAAQVQAIVELLTSLRNGALVYLCLFPYCGCAASIIYRFDLGIREVCLARRAGRVKL